MTLTTITGNLAGAGFAFECDASDLGAFAAVHLAPLTRPNPASATALPAVTATLRWHEGQPPTARPVDAGGLARMERVDRDLYVGRMQLNWFRVDDLRDLFLQVTWKDNQLRVEGDFYYRLGNSRLSDTIRRGWQWRRRTAMRARRFTTLLAYLVYYPCWWWLEQMTDHHPIHAAGVLTDAGALLLAGASGVGKSTLATALALSPGARLLSDSFVLHRGVEVLPVREPVLLDSFSRQWLGSSANELQPVGRGYGLNRSGYHFPAARLADGGRAAVVLFPRRSPEPYVRRLSAEDAHRRLSAADLIINDLRRYWAFAAVMEQLVPSGLVARREAQLEQLMSSVPCYDLGVTATATSAETVDTVMRLLPNGPRRVANARV